MPSYTRRAMPVNPTKLKGELDIEHQHIQRSIPASDTKLLTAAYTLTAKDRYLSVDCTGGAVTVTLPANAAQFESSEWTVTKVDVSGNAVTISGTVSGVVNPTLATQWKSMTVYSDGVRYIKAASV